MTDDLKQLILKAADILQSHGATEVFFFGSAARAGIRENRPIDLAVAGLPPDAYFKAMGAVLCAIKRPCNLVDLDESNPYVDYLKSHGKLQPDLFSRIRNELLQLRGLLGRYAPLIDRCGTTVPDDAETMALAGVLQLLYHGIDKIFTMIATDYDGGIQRGATDADVLERVAKSVPGRGPVISDVLMKLLQPYMSLRQVFCHSYSYDLSWPKIEILVRDVEEVFMLVEVELGRFIDDRITTTS